MRRISDKILIVGGDSRFEAAEKVLRQEGFKVKRISGGEENSREEMDDASVLLLPVPYTADGVTVFQPDAAVPVPLSAVYGCFQSGKTVFCGKADPEIAKRAKEKGVTLIDFMNDEALAVKNAVLTAEGAVSLALDLLPFTLNGAGALVLGFGRIGKLLAADLKGLGAKVTVAARKPDDRAFAGAFGYGAVPFSELAEVIGKADVVFNTVPAAVLTEEELKIAGKETLLIDLASKPGGIDRNAAAALGLNAVWALALPGKCAPVSAGTYIAETVIRLLSERMEQT